MAQLDAEVPPLTRKGDKERTKGRTPKRATRRFIGIQTQGQERPAELLGGLVTYVDDLLLAMPKEHLKPIVELLLKKHVMKKSGLGSWDAV